VFLSFFSQVDLFITVSVFRHPPRPIRARQLRFSSKVPQLPVFSSGRLSQGPSSFQDADSFSCVGHVKNLHMIPPQRAARSLFSYMTLLIALFVRFRNFTTMQAFFAACSLRLSAAQLFSFFLFPPPPGGRQQPLSRKKSPGNSRSSPIHWS